MVRIGVIGYGYWGPNIVRNLQGLDSTRTELICDSSPVRASASAESSSERESCFGCE